MSKNVQIYGVHLLLSRYSAARQPTHSPALFLFLGRHFGLVSVSQRAETKSFPDDLIFTLLNLKLVIIAVYLVCVIKVAVTCYW